jgi:hypothetical protein
MSQEQNMQSELNKKLTDDELLEGRLFTVTEVATAKLGIAFFRLISLIDSQTLTNPEHTENIMKYIDSTRHNVNVGFDMLLRTMKDLTDSKEESKEG